MTGPQGPAWVVTRDPVEAVGPRAPAIDWAIPLGAILVLLAAGGAWWWRRSRVAANAGEHAARRLLRVQRVPRTMAALVRDISRVQGVALNALLLSDDALRRAGMAHVHAQPTTRAAMAALFAFRGLEPIPSESGRPPGIVRTRK